MKRLALVAICAACIGVGLGSQVLDTPVVNLPCVVQATAVAADSAGTIRAFVFTCQDGRVFTRRGESQTLPSSDCPGLSPFPGGICQDGGWLPVGHPARRTR